MSSTVLTLVGSVAIVFIAAVIFVNAIEWIGCRCKLGCSFVGAILSPLFTSFPELTVFLVAVLAYRGEAGEGIGLGTLFGQPFMASSLAYGMVGIAALIGFLHRKRLTATLAIDRTLALPYVFITVLFPLTLVPVFVGGAVVKHVFGVIFLGAFGLYVFLMYRRRLAELIEDSDALYFCKVTGHTVPGQWAGAILQIGAAVAMLFFGSEKMVGAVDTLSRGIGISPLGLALIIVPAATAIPETASALIWGYRGKDTLSLGSLVGEKILYSTFYPGLGLFLTSWKLDVHAMLSVAGTTVVSLILLIFILRQKVPWYALCFGLFFFVAYAIMVFALRI